MTVNEARPCFPEWCETGQEPHSDVCDNAPMQPMTKHEFVEFMEAAAKHGIEAYRFLVDDGEEFSVEEMTGMAVDEVAEAATCMAGIGSCGRGWCNHS